MIKTITVSGVTEINFNTDGNNPYFYTASPYCWVRNKSDTSMYVSLSDNISAGTDGTAEVYTTNSAYRPIKSGVTSGGGIKLKTIRYPTEEVREHFDNNNNSASAIVTIIGLVIAMILSLDFIVMMWIATIGNVIDNIFYILFIIVVRKGGPHNDISI